MRIPVLMAVWLFAATIASGQQLGQTREAIVAKNGPAIEENHSKNAAVYRKGPWKVEVTYGGNIATSLTITKIDTLTEADIARIFSENSAAGPWQELRMGTTTRHWQGRDFATAQCDRVNPRTLRLTAGPFGSTPQKTVSSSISFAPPLPARSSALNARHSSTAVKSATFLVGNALAGLVVLFFGFIFLAILFRVVLPLVLGRGKGGSGGSTGSALPSPGSNPPPLPAQALSLTLDAISWENFELLAGEIFRRQGFEVEISSGLGADGGKDLTLRHNGEVRLVQCKCLSAENKVSVMAMREFYGLLMAENATSGIFMTTGRYSRDAREFAEGKPIELLGRAEIERLMASVTQPGENLCLIRNWIDDFAAVARVTDPDCPRCRKPMKLRRGATGRMFWGCSLFAATRCRGKRDARTELVRAFSYQQS